MKASALLFFAMAAVALGGCGGGGGSDGGSSPPPTNNNPPPPTFSASSGVAQKGPLILGSAVTAQELSAALVPTGKQYSYQTTSDFGTFNPNSAFTSRYIGVAATGYYFDEVTNALSSGPITLQGYADLSAVAVLNVNLLTTLASQRIQTLVTTGTAFTAAQAQAEREVLAALSIPASAAVGNFGQLDLSKSSEGNRVLAAISAMFCYGNTPANLAALIANVQSDIGANGRITSSATLATLSAAARSIDPAVIAANLNAKYASAGLALTPADIGGWMDHDGDGVVGNFEFQVADASESSVFALPADFVTKNAGASIGVAGGRLSINGAPVVTTGEIRAGDAVALSPSQGAFPNGIARVYVTNGSIKLARVSFVRALRSIVVTPPDSSVPAGITQQFQAAGTFSDGSTADVTAAATWQSNSTAVASVTGNGRVKGLHIGAATITATLGAVSGSATLNVAAAALQSISLSSTRFFLAPLGTRQLTATGSYSDGSSGDLTSTATWSSSHMATATVTGGLVTGVAVGTTEITAASGTLSASATLSIATELWTLAAAGPWRSGHTATLLPDGRVLVVGGHGAPPCCPPTATTFIYNPIADSWSPAANLSLPRLGQAATLLASGKVLVLDGLKDQSNNPVTLTGEIYDPAANAWSPTPPMPKTPGAFSPILLPNGKVLVIGTDVSLLHSEVEIFDPVANAWEPAASAGTARFGHGTIVLNNGKVLVAGGASGPAGPTSGPPLLASAELYDPATNSWSPAGVMADARYRPAIAKLADGRVLVAGGSQNAVQRLATAEIYDPATNTWSQAASMADARYGSTAITLPNGKVMVVAGNWFLPPMTVEIYDPAADTWLAAPDLLGHHSDTHSALLLPSGAVFVFGGDSDVAEIYQ